MPRGFRSTFETYGGGDAALSQAVANLEDSDQQADAATLLILAATVEGRTDCGNLPSASQIRARVRDVLSNAGVPVMHQQPYNDCGK